MVANDVPQLSTRRITITFPVIDRALCALVLVTGEAKARALAEVLEGPPDPARLPSQRLRALAGASWLVDAAAASLLRAGPQQR
jgi:6-phosphogluconolactonase